MCLMESCDSSGNKVDNHFAEVRNMVIRGADGGQVTYVEYNRVWY